MDSKAIKLFSVLAYITSEQGHGAAIVRDPDYS